MDDFNHFEMLADLPENLVRADFAMDGATSFGMKAMPLLGGTKLYGDEYPKILKTASIRSITQGNLDGATTDIDKEFLVKAGLSTFDSKHSLLLVVEKCDEVIKARETEKLMEKLDKQIKPKSETRQQSMKMKI
ncbi:hypothetical protein [Variovorax sp. RA8]|uniref:hypothetical protein n=1 Tax=Variovorax sp. (strain JCM 16519 / RA8) TaxID=662548 RepID=UPI0013A58CC4|nr:hypothetical protein [Variovorax sp. RA8]